MSTWPCCCSTPFFSLSDARLVVVAAASVASMGFFKLLLLCSFMFGCSMAVGCLPLVFSFSHRHLRTLTTFGVGLLIGTAFIVIIPEGIHTLYTPPALAHAHTHTATSTTSTLSPGVLDADYWQRWWQGSPQSVIDAHDDHEHGSHGADDQQPSQQQRSVKPHILLHDHDDHTATTVAAAAETPAIVRVVAAPRTQGEAAESTTAEQEATAAAAGRSLLQHTHNEVHEEADAAEAVPGSHMDVAKDGRGGTGEDSEGESECVFEPDGSGYIGASLALGFVVMLVVDRLSGGHSHGPPSSSSQHSAPTRDRTGSHRSTSSKWTSGSGSGGSRRSVDDVADEDDELHDVVQRTSIIHIAAPNTRPAATQHSQEVGREKEKELTAEEREKERERQRVAREKERERAHGYAPYASGGSLPSLSDASVALSSSAVSSNATIGILVHSFVDGIALGAISLSSDTSLEMVVFLAILLHKGPAALGLVAFLMYQGRSQLYIRTQLTMFSLCAPVAALLTFALLAAPLPSASSALPSPSSPSALGLMLLFSGGTFLFTIAVHIMPTIRQTNSRPSHSHSHGHSHHHTTADDGSSEHGHGASAATGVGRSCTVR